MKTEQPLLITTVKHNSLQSVSSIPARRAFSFDGYLPDETMPVLGITTSEADEHSQVSVMCKGIALCETFNTLTTYTPGMQIAVRDSAGRVGPVEDDTSLIGQCLDSVSGSNIFIRVLLK